MSDFLKALTLLAVVLNLLWMGGFVRIH